MVFENEKGNEIEKCRPHHRLKRSKNFSRNNGCNRVRSIVESIDEIKYQSQRYDRNKQN
jgi:hypothetical protein